MRPVSQWDRTDLEALIRDGVQESLTIEYKRSASLGRSSERRNEISKDVSAFANSAGGTIVYGIIEKDHQPVGLDEGKNTNEISREWLDQTIKATIQPRITGIIIQPIAVSANNYAYAISIPQATALGPHQANDQKYYRRFNFESVPMYDYEIRDVLQRGTAPDLFINISVEGAGPGDIGPRVAFKGQIGNRSAAPALYSSVLIFLDARIAPEKIAKYRLNETEAVVDLQVSGQKKPIKLKVFDQNLSVPHHQPLYRERDFRIFDFTTTIPNSDSLYYIGYRLTCPGFNTERTYIIRRDGEQVTLSALES
jgi:hypothetical protein